MDPINWIDSAPQGIPTQNISALSVLWPECTIRRSLNSSFSVNPMKLTFVSSYHKMFRHLFLFLGPTSPDCPSKICPELGSASRIASQRFGDFDRWLFLKKPSLTCPAGYEQTQFNLSFVTDLNGSILQNSSLWPSYLAVPWRGPPDVIRTLLPTMTLYKQKVATRGICI